MISAGLKQAPAKRKRKSPRKRKQIIESSSESIIESDSEGDICNTPNQPDLDCEMSAPSLSELGLLQQEMKELKLKLQKSEELVLKLQEQNEMLQNQMFNYKNISKNEKTFRKTTGIQLSSFQAADKGRN